MFSGAGRPVRDSAKFMISALGRAPRPGALPAPVPGAPGSAGSAVVTCGNGA